MANQFLVKETMAAMRGLLATEITALQSGTYDGVQLLGYYKKGDTPAPIIYHYVDLLKDPDPGPDDGGSVIAVGGIKLFHNYVGDINLLYFGLQEGQVLNSYLTKALRITANTGSFTIIPKGSFLIDRSYTPIFNSRIKGIDRNLTKIILNPATATDSGAFENYMFLNLNGNFELTDVELDANAPNLSASVSRSSGIDNRNAVSNATYKRLRIKNAKTVLPNFSGGYGITFWHGGCDHVMIDDIEFENIGQSDLGLFEMENWTVRNIKSKNCGYMVINVESSNNSRGVKNGVVDTVYASNVGRSVISLIRNSASVGNVESVTVQNVSVDKCGLTNSDVGGIRVRGTKNCTIDNVKIDECNSVGIRVSGDWFGFKGTVNSYADLASLTGLNKGDIYSVSSEGLLYTYLDNQFQQQGQGQSQELLKCKNLMLSNISINKIQTTINGEGVRVQGEAFCSHDDITLSDIYIGNSQSTGVLATYSNRITVNNLKIDKINTSRGMQFTLCNDIHVQGGYISNIGNYGAGFTDCKDVLISGLKITNPGVSAFYFNNATDAVKIIGCTTRDNKSPKLMTNSVIVESNLPARNPKYIIADNDFEDAIGNKITIQNGVIQDRIKISNNVGI